MIGRDVELVVCPGAIVLDVLRDSPRGEESGVLLWIYVKLDDEGIAPVFLVLSQGPAEVFVVSSLARPCGWKRVIRGRAAPRWIEARDIGLTEVAAERGVLDKV